MSRTSSLPGAYARDSTLAYSSPVCYLISGHYLGRSMKIFLIVCWISGFISLTTGWPHKLLLVILGKTTVKLGVTLVKPNTWSIL